MTTVETLVSYSLEKSNNMKRYFMIDRLFLRKNDML